MSGILIADGSWPVFDDDGNPVSGAIISIFNAGTSTPAVVYSDKALTSSIGSILSTNAAGIPQKLDATAVARVWWISNGFYDVKINVNGSERVWSNLSPISDFSTDPYEGQAILRLVVKVYIEDVAGVVEGASGNAVTNTAAIQAYLDTLSSSGGGTVYLRPNSRINISQRINLPSNVGIVYEGSDKQKPHFYMPAAYFNNTTIGAGSDYTNGCAFAFIGQISGLYTPKTNLLLEGFALESEVSDHRFLNGIALRNAHNVKLNGLEGYGFCLGDWLAVDSVYDAEFNDLYIHDNETSYGLWSAGSATNVTGICVDNYRINSISSHDILIKNLRTDNLLMKGAALTALGHQSDGITINPFAYGIRVISPSASYVGEGIDCMGSGCVISDVNYSKVMAYGVKLMHGSSNNSVTGGRIKDAGISHVVFAGSNSAGVGNTQGNVITGITMTGFAADGYYTSSQQQACVSLQGSAGSLYKAQYNRVEACTYDGTGGDFVFRDDYQCENNFVAGQVIAKGSVGMTNITFKSNVFLPNGGTKVISKAVTETVVAAAGNLPIIYGSETVDSLGEWNTGTGVFTAAYSGYRQVSANNRLQNPISGALYQTLLSISGGDTRVNYFKSAVSADLHISISTMVYMVEGQQLTNNLVNGGAGNVATTATPEIANITISGI